MLLWMILGAMMLAAALIVCLPLYRGAGKRAGPALASAAVVIVVASALLYIRIGSPGAPSGPAAMPSVDEMVESLAERLQANPDDVAGWRMLGRSYVQLQRYADAVAAYEQALARETENPQTQADLAEAMMLARGEGMQGRPAELIESSLALAPNNPKALLYGGIAAIERGDAALAADRWEALLALSPPPEIEAVLRERIALWRGEPEAAPSGLHVGVSVSDEALRALPANATVFIIARDPTTPGPPVAVARRSLSELPATVTLTDADSMIPGRTLAAFRELEIVVRASASGQPQAAAGDWFGSRVIDTASMRDIDIAIDQPVAD